MSKKSKAIKKAQQQKFKFSNLQDAKLEDQLEKYEKLKEDKESIEDKIVDQTAKIRDLRKEIKKKKESILEYMKDKIEPKKYHIGGFKLRVYYKDVSVLDIPVKVKDENRRTESKLKFSVKRDA